MLSTILSISGKSGLYRLISQGRGTLIVESLETAKRIPVMARDRVVSLGDISMYTDGEDVALAEIMQSAYQAFEGQPVDLDGLKTTDALSEAFGRVLPSFDRERVYTSDIRKFFTWYNLLLKAGFTSFVESETPEQ